MDNSRLHTPDCICAVFTHATGPQTRRIWFVAGSAAGFVGLGLLVLIPGAYASTIAAGAWLQVPGFKFEMMPRMVRSS